MRSRTCLPTTGARVRGLYYATVFWSSKRYAAALVRRSVPATEPGCSLPVFLIGALLLCHGVLGFTHQTSHGFDAPHLPPIAAGAGKHVVGHAGGHGAEDPACGHMFTGYFAVVLVLFGAGVLGLLLRARKRRRVTVLPPCRLRSLLAFDHPPRGPSLPLLQVFRL